MSRPRRRFSPQDKLRLVLEGIADEGTIAIYAVVRGYPPLSFTAGSDSC